VDTERYAEIIAELLSVLPPELTVIIVAASPVFELRGAIPLAVGYFGMSPLKSFALAVFGNFLPIVPLLVLLGYVSNWLAYHSSAFERFFTWLFERTRERVEDRYEKYGALVLVPLVAVPLPGTGAWTGCAAAFVFGIRFSYSVTAITAGVLISGVLVTAASVGAFGFLGIL